MRKSLAGRSHSEGSRFGFSTITAALLYAAIFLVLALVVLIVLPFVRGSSLARGLADARRPRRLASLSSMPAEFQLAGDPTQVGQWSPLYSWPNVGILLHLLPTGQVLSLQGPLGNGVANHSTVGFVVNIPSGGAPSSSLNVTMTLLDAMCAGSTLLADGRLMLIGGEGVQAGDGIKNVELFDPVTDTWAAATPMNLDRWYATGVTLPSGAVLALGGTDYDFSVSPPKQYVQAIPEVTNDNGASWQSLPTAGLPTQFLPIPDGFFPRSHVAPDGRIFVTGPPQQSYFLSADLTTGTPGPLSHFAGRANWGRTYDGSVMYDDGKILIAGGGEYSTNPAITTTNTAETIDLNAPTPVWTLTGSMTYARNFLSTTILPDGSVLATGGGSNFDDCSTGALEAEQWNPSTGTWALEAPMAHIRMDHSTAVLLPDARVLVAGGTQLKNFSTGGTCGPYADAQIFSPPYLFRGTRPMIVSAPTHVAYGQQFFVGTNSNDITAVTLLALGSVTHADNFTQRLTRPAFTVCDGTACSGGITVTAPANPNLAPPGYFMLFVLNSAGIPSIAPIIQVGSVAATPTPTATPTATATATASPMVTATPTATATFNSTPTATATGIAATVTATATVTAAPTPSAIPTPTATATPGLTQIVLRAPNGTNKGYFLSGTAVTPQLPAGSADGDCLVLAIYRPLTTTVSCGAGWTSQIQQGFPGTPTKSLAVFTHLCASGDCAGGPTCSWTGSSGGTWVDAAYTGVAGAAPSCAIRQVASQANGASMVATSPSLANGTAGDQLLMLYAAQLTLKFQAPISEGAIEVQNSANGSAVLLDFPIASTNPTGPQTVTMSASSPSAGAQMLLQPIPIHGASAGPAAPATAR